MIVGAGAAGLMCAWLLARQDRKVMVLEKNKVPGKKLLATGNGRCNFTNLQMNTSCYYGKKEFVEPLLSRFGPEAAIRLFEEMGMWYRERDGYCYPMSGQSITVVESLMRACRREGVLFSFETRVSKIVHNGTGFEIRCKGGDIYRSRYLVLAAGGKANAPLGGEGSGYKLCRSLQHHISPIYPGLTGLVAEGREWRRLAGVRMQGEISLFADNRCLGCQRGEIQIVKDGISGIPVFQVCRLAAEALDHGRKVGCCIDFFPEREREEIRDWLERHGNDGLLGLVHKKWAEVLLERAGVGGRSAGANELAGYLKAYPVAIRDTFGIERAQVTAGGVELDEIDPITMESGIHKGLYIVGELLDVDGICGGYNLHFAWASAWACSEAIGG